jgi:hypothetical protein
MAVKKATTTSDLKGDAGGPPALDPTPTVPVDNYVDAPAAANLTEDKPDERKQDKVVSLKSPAGTKVRIADGDAAKALKAQGYK